MSASDELDAVGHGTRAVGMILAVGFALLAVPSQSRSQPADSADAARALEEVIVATQRRQETLQHAAVAVDVVTSAHLAQSETRRRAAALSTIRTASGDLTIIPDTRRGLLTTAPHFDAT